MYQLFNDDCFNIFPQIPNNTIDFILCDLPFNTTKRKTTWNEWDKPIDIDNLFKEYKRILKENGCICLFANDTFGANLIVNNLDIFKYKWIWQKEMGTGFLNAKRMPLRDTEDILVFYKKQPTYNPQMREGTPYVATKGSKSNNYCSSDKIVTTVNNGERYPITTLKYNRDKDKFHPTQKPIALLEYLIKTYTNENDLVLDNCMGSGSCGVACVNTNRDFIGIEIDKTYFEIVGKRIKDVSVI